MGHNAFLFFSFLFFFERDRSQACMVDFHHLKFVWLTWPSHRGIRSGRFRRSGSAEGGLAKYLITFELTYRYREITGLFLAPRGSLSARLRNVVRIYGSSRWSLRRGVPAIGSACESWNESSSEKHEVRLIRSARSDKINLIDSS